MKTDARVEIAHAFPDQPQADFVDTLLLHRVPVDAYGTALWRIDNLAYATGGDLRSLLAEAFTE